VRLGYRDEKAEKSMGETLQYNLGARYILDP
jgi:hypothetical protein